MPRFSEKSLTILATCDERLQRICMELIRQYDVKIIQGFRGQMDQEKAVKEGKSKKHWPMSKHNQHPSIAVDVVPFPIDWEDRERFFYMAGLFMAIANFMGIGIRWGGDWDRDKDFDDQRFDDLPHIELISN
ncbi:MAG: M15 family peptidase [Dehalococcoidia bacterium]|nr:MAG: M15 family peptidase [Dehalococcoidia bacterium]